MKNKKHMGVLLSGGIDSNVLVADLLKKGFHVWPIYIRCDLPWEKAELYWTKRFLKTQQSPHLKALTVLRNSLNNAYRDNWSQNGKTPHGKTPDYAVFLPARNLILLTQALLYLYSEKIDHLALATLKGNPFQDGRSSYFKQLSRLLSLGLERPVYIIAPYRSINKQALLKRNKNIPLHISFSCINPRGYQHCGRCNKCAERKRAFKSAGIKDKSIYRR